MTNEEMERVMNFIIERQERMAERDEHQQLLLESLLESQNLLTETATRIAEAHQARLNRHDDEFRSVRESLDNLSRTVDRYITARGNGANGNN